MKCSLKEKMQQNEIDLFFFERARLLQSKSYLTESISINATNHVQRAPIFIAAPKNEKKIENQMSRLVARLSQQHIGFRH